MSLHKFAEQVAANGRGDDSLLVHMTPDEVRNLQRFAEANGTTLTINPETGLPEAGLLSDLFKAVAPIALGAFLGPAGFGMSAGMAGLATGGITALATGSLSRGLMAGLGAYGGAGLGASLAGAGGAELAASGMPVGAENVAGAAVPPIEQVNPTNYLTADKLSAGAKAVTASPGAALDFAKANYKPLMAAAAPIMAGAMVPTTTPLGEPKSTGYIRQMDFNINPDTGKPDPLYGVREMTPIKASEFKDKTFQGQRELFRQQNPNPYEIGVASLNQPPRMAGGGIVALAGGGVTDQQIKDWFATNQGASDTDIYNAMKQYNVGTEQLTNAMGFDPTEVGRRYDVQARNDIFSPTRSRSEQESMVNQYYQDQGIPADRLSQTNFGYPVDTRESRLESAPYTNLYEKYQQDLAATGRYDAPSDAQYRAQAVYMPDSIGNRGSIQLIDTATGQQLTNFGANDIGNTRNAFELLDKFGVDPTSYRNAATQMYESLGKPTYMQDDYAYLTGYKPRDVTGKTDTYLTKPLTNVTMADLKPKYEKDDNARQTADSKTNVFWMRPMQELLMSKGMGASEATNYLHQLTPVSGLVDWAEISRSKDPVKAIIGTLNYLQSKGLTNRRFASGGLASLADNIPGYANGALVSDQQIFDYFKTPGLTDAKIAADMQTYNVSAADIARATGTGARQGEYESRFVQAINKPDTSAQEFQAMTADVGLQNQALENAMDTAGMSQAAQYAATHNLTDTKAPQTDFYNQFGYKLGALPGDQGGLEGYYANINYSAQGLQSLIDAGKMTGQQAREAALTEMNRIGMSAADLKAATGKTLAQLFPDTKVVTPITKITGTGGTGGTVTPPPFTTVIPGGNYGRADGSTPGDITTNPDGTVTVHPNIPYRPPGGFSGMGEVKDAYTKGGGSLGYTAKAPTTIEEFNSRFNKMTGDSLAAYNYLMGKGANNNAYPVKSGVSQIAVPYNEFVLGKKSTRPAVKTTETKTVVGVPGQPQTYFDEAAYLAANPDVAAELKTGKSASGQPTKFTSAYDHYLMYGKTEGRPFTGDYQGYLTALALASAAGAGGGGEGPSAPSANNSGTISGFTPAPPDMSIPEASMGIGPAADGNTGSTTGTEGGNVASAKGGLLPRGYAMGGLGSLGAYSDGGRLLKGPGDGVSDSIPATIGAKRQPARLADGEFVIPARIVSELGNGSTDAGAKKLYAMMDRVQKARGKTTGKNKVAANSRADKYLPA